MQGVWEGSININDVGVVVVVTYSAPKVGLKDWFGHGLTKTGEGAISLFGMIGSVSTEIGDIVITSVKSDGSFEFQGNGPPRGALASVIPNM